MPIFTRRQLQQMLNELGPWLVRSKATDLLKRLENGSPDQAIPAEFELALSWALTKSAQLEIDRPMGNRTPDIYSPDLFSSAPLSVESPLSRMPFSLVRPLCAERPRSSIGLATKF